MDEAAFPKRFILGVLNRRSQAGGIGVRVYRNVPYAQVVCY